MSAVAIAAEYSQLTSGLIFTREFTVDGFEVHPQEMGIRILMGMLVEKWLLTNSSVHNLNPVQRYFDLLRHNSRIDQFKRRISADSSSNLKAYIVSKVRSLEPELERLHRQRIQRAQELSQAVLSRQSWIAAQASWTFRIGNTYPWTIRNGDSVRNLLNGYALDARRMDESAQMIRECEMILGAATIFVEHSVVERNELPI